MNALKLGSIFTLIAIAMSATALRAEAEYRPETDTRPVKIHPEPMKEAAPPVSPAPKSEEEEFKKPVLTGELDFTAVEMIAIQEGGRKKPLHTYAQEHIEQLVGRSVFASQPSLKLDDVGGRVPMMDLFLSMWLQTRDWKDVPCILINYRPLREKLGFDTEKKHFSVANLLDSKEWQTLLNTTSKKRHDGKDKELTDMEKEVEIVHKRTELLGQMVQGWQTLNIIPHPKESTGTWMSLMGLRDSFAPDSASLFYSRERADETFEKFTAFARAYYKRDKEAFTKASQEFHLALATMSPEIYPTFDQLHREVTYNKARPFGKAWWFYLSAFILGLFALKLRGTPVYAAVMAVFLVGLALQVYGFVLRCQIAGRPPVSNMYESVIWVGFGAVLFGLIFELIYKSRYYVLSGAGGGFLCLVMMDQLPVVMGNASMPGFEASIKPLVPVLRDNFWLTVHVLTITLSYAAFMLGWVLGHVTLFSHLFRPSQKAEHHELHQFIYRVMQVGVLLLTIGTILGGVWAYYSWGRFWGWDPKETWAFIALLCYLFVLHGRFTGWWGNFGMSVGSVVCFQAVVMAWYGVNFVLGSLGNGGLHSYGTGAGGEAYVAGALIVDLIFTVAAIARHQSYEAAQRSESEQLTDTDPVTDARAEFAE